MIDTPNTTITPILSFDFYIENYHKLTLSLKKEVDLKALNSVLRIELDGKTKQIIEEEPYEAMVVTSPDRQIVWVNQGFAEMTGYDKKFALGKNPKFLQGEKTEKETIHNISKHLNQQQVYSGSIINYRKNGERYRCDIKILPLYNSKQELTHFIALEREAPAA
ncbi:PAS domain-containing protein [Flagellimonas okinawensis]|uniref:PAS domain-containing protein n=1 Tax=Flagellimonas okinawensis TaxID=3031324 RepID=A0ABT5XQ91_9FLAO|nr:PAS domain-containing protein [[Muricauda] okinawensis]MDF0707756.1 PAS domain-containing protein [[Muricauda] okinawensis]